MGIKVSLVVLSSMMFLTQPVRAMDVEHQSGQSSVAIQGRNPCLKFTLTGIPEELQVQIYSFVKAPRDVRSLLLLNKSTNGLLNDNFLDSPHKKIAYLEGAAAQGDVNSQYRLGQYYQKGILVPKSMKEAYKYLTLAAKQNHLKAQGVLGQIYRDDYIQLKMEDDRKNAIFWLTKAAERGKEAATIQCVLGYDYFDGALNNEGKPDYSEAARWFGLAAENGDNVAQYILGKAHHDGMLEKAIPIDLAKAMKWYNLAAKQGDSLAQAALQSIRP